ncbi:MAG: hypothetical protein VX869_01175 [Chloroflexota bacterium]|nr:hypothetical protein [Chloroflexota bacterium]
MNDEDKNRQSDTSKNNSSNGESDEELNQNQDSPRSEKTERDETTPVNSIEVESVPEDVILYRQSHWAWLMPSSLWIGGLSVVVFFDFLTMGFIPLLLAIGIAAPRYFRWRQTTYYLSEDSLYLTMVGLPIIQKKRTFRLAFDTMVQLDPRFGYFGRTLGYAEVGIIFDDKRMARLGYMANYGDFISHITDRTSLPGSSEDQDSEKYEVKSEMIDSSEEIEGGNQKSETD